ncbi:MAG: type II secretion system protein GspN [Deltaproteobacteria bacterium]|nr:type II secretion system protein GspN [Deltaproteobacteria bacterium]
MKRIRRWVLYPGYVLGITVLFLYVLFPSDAAKEYISGYLGKQYPGYTVTMETVKPVFPLGLKFDSVSIAYRGDTWADLEHLRVRPRYLSIFGSEKTIRFTGRAYGGKVSGTIDLQPAQPSYRVKASAELTGIRLEDHNYLQTFFGRKIAGVLHSTIGYSSEKAAAGRLNVSMQVVDGEVGLTNPVLNISNVDFERVDAELIVDKRSLKLKRCEITGSQVDGSVSGVILFRKPIGRSRLEFKGTVLPHHLLMASLNKVLPKSLLPSKKAGDKGYPVKLYGTIEKPKFSLR